MFEWGRRASDRATSAPAAPVQDLLLEGAIAHEQIEVLLSAFDRAEDGPYRRRRGAGALVHRAVGRSAVRAGDGGGPRRAACRGWSSARRLRCAACLGRSAQGPQDLAQPASAGLVARENYEQWLLDEIESAGHRSQARDGRDHRKRAAHRPARCRGAPDAACARPGSRLPSTISAPATQASPI